MSVRAMNAAIASAAPSHTAKLVMMVLAHHHHSKTGRCFPSYERIAEEAGLAKSSVTRAIAELVTAGLIQKIKGRRAGSFNAPNSYKLIFIAQVALVEERARHKGYDRHGRAALPDKAPPTSTAKASEVGVKPKRRSHKRLPRLRMEPLWRPSPKLMAEAAAKGFTGPEIERMVLDFRDYYIARGEISASWGVDFSRWMRRQVDFKEQNHAREARTGPGGRGEQRMEDLRGTFAAAHEAVRRRQRRDGGGEGDSEGGPAD